MFCCTELSPQKRVYGFLVVLLGVDDDVGFFVVAVSESPDPEPAAVVVGVCPGIGGTPSDVV